MAEQNKIKTTGLQSAKARIVIFVICLVTIVALAFAVWHHHNVKKSLEGSSSVISAPSIDSVPGSGNPSENYVRTQNIANAEGNQQALKNATSFVPTITRPSFVGNTDNFEQEEQA